MDLTVMCSKCETVCLYIFQLLLFVVKTNSDHVGSEQNLRTFFIVFESSGSRPTSADFESGGFISLGGGSHWEFSVPSLLSLALISPFEVCGFAAQYLESQDVQWLPWHTVGPCLFPAPSAVYHAFLIMRVWPPQKTRTVMVSYTRRCQRQRESQQLYRRA